MNKKYFTLLEMSVVLLIIVALSSFMVNMALPLVNDSTEFTLRQKVKQIEEAIAGKSSNRDFDGSLIPNGYINDMGAFPNPNASGLSYDYEQLVENLPSLALSQRHSLSSGGSLLGGWRGPYILESDFSKLLDRIKLTLSDEDGDGQNDLIISVTGYSGLTRTIYWKDHFQEREISIANLPEKFTADITAHFIKDGSLNTLTDLNIKAGDTVNFSALPKSLSAFSARLYLDTTIPADHTVLQILSTQPTVAPSDGEKYLVASVNATGDFLGKEDQIAVWNLSENRYDFLIPDELDTTVLNASTAESLFFYDGNWVTERLSSSTKTLRSDFLLELD